MCHSSAAVVQADVYEINWLGVKIYKDQGSLRQFPAGGNPTVNTVDGYNRFDHIIIPE